MMIRDCGFHVRIRRAGLSAEQAKSLPRLILYIKKGNPSRAVVKRQCRRRRPSIRSYTLCIRVDTRNVPPKSVALIRRVNLVLIYILLLQ
jgi:hypothetical protein